MKALFSDFYGTLVKEDSPTSLEVADRIYRNGNGASLEEVVTYWWHDYRERIAEHCGENWRSQHDLALDTLEHLLEHFACDDDARVLRDMMSEHWCNPLIFDDAKRFLEGLKGLEVPVYFVTNSDDRYLVESMKNNGISCDGFITSERARYSKPRTEIFQYALDALSLQPEEVVHIGDSLGSDVACPASLGIRAIWLNRNGAQVPDGIIAATDLDAALAILRTM